MIISHKHKFVFIHVPRTAGNSIKQAILSSISDNEAKKFIEKTKSEKKYHFTYSQIINNWQVEKYFIFAVVRNPWDLAVSHYFYAKRSKEHIEHNKTLKNSFAHLVRRGYPEYPSCFNRLSENGRLKVDYIIRFEELEKGFNEVCARIGIKCELSHLNKSNHDHYSKYYSDERVKNLIAKKYKKDIYYFNYSFQKE